MISKIILNGVTQMDLTSDTVDADSLLVGKTAHGADGAALVGALEGGSWVKSLSAVFDTTGLAVLTTDELDDLRDRLTVTATYVDDTSEVVTSYELSGTLSAGTSTVIVTYGDGTTSFTVDVFQATDITPAMSDSWGTGSNTTLVKNESDKSFFVFSTSNGTYKALTYGSMSYEEGYAYRLSADCEYFAGTIKLAFVNSSNNIIEYTPSYTASGHYTVEGILSDSALFTATGGLRLFITYSTSEAGRAVFRNVKVVKYAVTVPQTLKVMTYNVQMGNGINSQTDMQTAIFSQYNADLIGLQECSTWASLPSKLSALDGYAVKQFSNHKNKVCMVKKTGSLSNVVIADFTHQDPLDASQYNETRAYIKADFTRNGKTITWINTHLCFLTPSVMYQQMAEVFALAEQCEYCIITGDFNSGVVNATSENYLNMYKQFVDAGYNLANNSPTAGFQNTYTSATTASTLADLSTAPDTIITSGNITISDVVFDTTKFDYLNGSSIDHIPVVCTLTIN